MYLCVLLVVDIACPVLGHDSSYLSQLSGDDDNEEEEVVVGVVVGVVMLSRFDLDCRMSLLDVSLSWADVLCCLMVGVTAGLLLVLPLHLLTEGRGILEQQWVIGCVENGLLEKEN